MSLRLFVFLFSATWLFANPALSNVDVKIGYLRQEVSTPPVLSNLDSTPEDIGIAGAKLGVDGNQTTGAFLGHKYSIEVFTVPVGGDLVAQARKALAHSRLLVLDAPARDILTVADLPEAEGAILINTSEPQTALRGEHCRANVLHTLPSNAARADALMQFLLKKRWTKLAMISGSDVADAELSVAFRTAAAKFGLKLAAEKEWNFEADMRRSAAKEIPLFTQDLGAHDVLLIADTRDDYGRYIPFNTWLPRPTAGTEGIVPVAWSPVVEQWGAAQLQSRFYDAANRTMHPRDYAAWAAVRAFGEAVTRTGSNDPTKLREYLLSDHFELAGFKGRPMSFRSWNGQLRQPIPLVTSRAMVAQAPLEGFLHQRNELDSLGLDLPDSQCNRFED